ncbi:MAG: hypothetical protein ACJA1N_002020, partial [Saprospiraceae bacterium]
MVLHLTTNHNQVYIPPLIFNNSKANYFQIFTR